MRRKAHILGFSLAEFMVVIAIIGILTVVAVPTYFSVIKKAEKTTCENNRIEIERFYHIECAIRSSAKNNPSQTMSEVLLTTFSAGRKSGTGYSGICPSDGAYFIETENSSPQIICGIHGPLSETTRNMLSSQMLKRLVDSQLVQDYFNSKNLNNGAQLNSSDGGIDKETADLITKELEKAGFDTSSISWQITKQTYPNGKDTNAFVMSLQKIDDLKAGDTIDVIRYNPVTNTYEKGKGKVSTTTKGDNSYNFIDTGENTGIKWQPYVPGTPIK